MTRTLLKRNLSGSIGLVLLSGLVPAAPTWAAPGDLDPTFGSGGVVTIEVTTNELAACAAVALAPDGRLVTAGSARVLMANGSRGDVAMVRYRSDGTLDPSFGALGVVTTSVGGFADGVNAVAVEPAGKIVGVGTSELDPGGFGVLLLRYDTDGALDSAFGVNGVVTTRFADAGAIATDLVLQADGKIVVGGGKTIDPVGHNQFLVMRYDSNGSLDPTFGMGGVVTINIPGASAGREAHVEALAVQSDGKIVAAGPFDAPARSHIAVVRFMPDGNLDPAFGTGGIVTTSVHDDTFPSAVVVQPDGRIVVAGSTFDVVNGFGANGKFAIVRYNGDGSPDTTFGAGGVVIAGPPAIEAGTADLTLQPNGKLVVVGYAVVGYMGAAPIRDVALARYNPDGSLDPSFGSGGVVMNHFAASNVGPLVLQPDGRIVEVGSVDRNGPCVGGCNPDAHCILVRYQGGDSASPTPSATAPTSTPSQSPAPTMTTALPTPTITTMPTPTSTRPPLCGNGVLNGSEECDDGNLIDGDGCDFNCTITRCGNGRVTAGEECDDGNANPADGCTNDCRACGNGVVTAPEQCDDGNRNDSDGCTNACTVCGNGTLVPGEQCDDGNAVSGDGCAANCRYELIPGNVAASTDKRACQLEWTVVNPNNTPRLDRRGRLNNTQTCHNGDATCDLGGDPLACEFRVAVCVNNLDPQLSSCTPQGVRAGVDVRFGGIDIVLPIMSRDPMNYTSLYQALQQFRDPNTGATMSLPIDSNRTNVCTDAFAIRVPLRTVGTRQFLGRVQLRTITRAQDTSPIPVMIDLDGLTLVCTP
ncbi:MAG: DUF4215 domain-containing protein [Deltaproteobacteria bacterium]|nr:DUF4215 domain-containing protein [Deltaproteobacteria bacterium]MBI3387240.1 DUF4215 domain-containing protein [Deltaproteobacteria bacterium]